MNITSIEPINKYSSKVYIDYILAFPINNKIIDKYNLVVDNEIEKNVYILICNEVYIQAKNKALDLIERSPKTRSELIQKLKLKYYSEETIDRVVNFLCEYNFLNDESYAKNYIQYNISKRSKKYIKYELQKKGINSQIIQDNLENYDNSSEIVQIEKYINRYRDSNGVIPSEKKNKIFSSLQRKGFSSNLILKYFRDNC